MPMFTMDNMRKLKRFSSLAHGKTWQMFVAFNSEAMADGAISQKHKQLISLAVALTTQCPYSIEIHRENAKACGATDEELAEVVFITAAIRASSAITHGTHLIHEEEEQDGEGE
ncbi:alkyl hydroperoxide reductase AhpD [Pseudovibrio japonicus]|uniref:Alkyl hydroperoxide reductase AhpD n=1 Tax=Pseudovibrio japonicus TaxID=366534 RepID=A0ABQ3E155_9HYPH|nr:carboxymuconolactone decarboxylase family protein [Pseudovibrio japonicus]GHB20073.1 alkyl hydroperoxide reductase AhpD [Pseudovibrio japonicus]